MNLAPGAYGRVVVQRRGSLTLDAGSYQFRSLELEDDAGLIANGSVDIHVQSEIAAGDRTRFGAGAGTAASAVMVFVEGSDASCGHVAVDDDGVQRLAAVHVGEKSVIRANVYAPNGTIWIKNDSSATGAFIGKQVRIGDGVRLTLDSGFRQ